MKRGKPPYGGQGTIGTRTGPPAGLGAPTSAPDFAKAHSAPMQGPLKRANPTAPNSGQTAQPGSQGGRSEANPKS